MALISEVARDALNDDALPVVVMKDEAGHRVLLSRARLCAARGGRERHAEGRRRIR